MEVETDLLVSEVEKSRLTDARSCEPSLKIIN